MVAPGRAGTACQPGVAQAGSADGNTLPRMPAALLSIGLVAWSVVANLGLGERWYTTRNLALIALLLLLARGLAVSWDELGLDPADLREGLRWGRLAVLVVALAVTAGAALRGVVPPLQLLLDDARSDLPLAELVHAVLVRIPLGTALFEELAFRGLLLAALLRLMSPRWAILWSSAAFGLWHVAPTIQTLRINEVAPESLAGLGAIAGAVVVTTVGGAVFAWLRVASGSLLAPVLAHWATNAFGLLAAAVTRATGSSGAL